MDFNRLKDEYYRLCSTMVIRPERRVAVDRVAQRIVENRKRYEAVEQETGVPWYVVGVIHNLEAGGRWDRHLHNGDPLTARTVQVPRGRPKAGSPPFEWDESAKDAIEFDGLNKVEKWDLPRICYELEKYNGWGYQRKGVPSPYLWSFTNHYSRGKYVADGRYDPSAVSAQAGAMALIRRIDELCPDVNLQADEPDPATEFVRHRVDRDPPASMATSSEGNTAVAVGGVSTTGMAMEVSAASAKVASAKTPTFMDLVWALLSSPTFLICAFTTLGAAFLWFRRAARLRMERGL